HRGRTGEAVVVLEVEVGLTVAVDERARVDRAAEASTEALDGLGGAVDERALGGVRGRAADAAVGPGQRLGVVVPEVAPWPPEHAGRVLGVDLLPARYARERGADSLPAGVR